MVELRRDVPVVVDDADGDDPRGDQAHAGPVALDVAGQQHHVGQHEVEDHQGPAHVLPAVLRADPVVRDLFLRVRRVDDDELRERQVGPQHDEREQELPEVVEVRGVDHVVEGLFLRQAGQHEDGEREGREAPADDVEQAPHGREPVRVHRHRPVDHGEGDGETVDEQPAARDAEHLVGDGGIPRAVLLGRQRAETQRQEAPDGEEADVARQKERHVEVGGLVADDRVGRRHVGVRPVIEVAHAGKQRHAEHRHHRDGAGGRFEDAPDHETPGAAREVLHHEQAEAADAHAGPGDPRDQVRLVEAVGPGHREADAGQHGADHGGDHALRLQAREALGWIVGFRCHVVFF